MDYKPKSHENFMPVSEPTPPQTPKQSKPDPFKQSQVQAFQMQLNQSQIDHTSLCCQTVRSTPVELITQTSRFDLYVFITYFLCCGPEFNVAFKFNIHSQQSEQYFEFGMGKIFYFVSVFFFAVSIYLMIVACRLKSCNEYQLALQRVNRYLCLRGSFYAWNIIRGGAMGFFWMNQACVLIDVFVRKDALGAYFCIKVAVFCVISVLAAWIGLFGVQVNRELRLAFKVIYIQK